MKPILYKIIVLICLYVLLLANSNLYAGAYDRVEEAKKQYQLQIDSLFDSLGVKYPPEMVLIVAYKNEQILQLWIKPDSQEIFLPIRNYRFTAYSGRLGPKRKQGDLQIPEGFYRINCFNPNSRFHLALGINYPNASDMILSDRNRPGGDIAIHGEAVTIGCIPIGNQTIEELYLICSDTYTRNRKTIPVYIFPCIMDSTGMEMLAQIAKTDSLLLAFWNNLKQGYDIFMTCKKLLNFRVNQRGRYVFE